MAHKLYMSFVKDFTQNIARQKEKSPHIIKLLQATSYWLQLGKQIKDRLKEKFI